MDKQKYIAIALAVLVAAADANSLQAKPKPLVLPSNIDARWDGLGLSADVNDYVDRTIHMIGPVMQQYGFDPMELPEVVEGFEVRPLLITYSAWLKIHDGQMRGLVNVARTGDQMVHYFAKMMRVRLRLQFTDLVFDYRYLVQVMNIGPTGGIVATLDRFVIVFDLLIDFNNDEVHLQEFAMTDIGRLRVRFTGNILTDWLMNSVLGVFMAIFDNIIIRVVAANIRSGIQLLLDFANQNIRIVFDALEAL